MYISPVNYLFVKFSTGMLSAKNAATLGFVVREMIELEHSPLGGSAAHRFMSCNASFLMQRAQIENNEFENVESEFAKLGTAAHELCALAVSTGTEPFEYFGHEFDGYKVGWPDGISLDAATVYFNACQRIIDRPCKPVFEKIVEKSYHLPELHPLLKGTVDFGFICSHGIYLIDYKNGAGIAVSSVGNKQLLYYAFLLAVGNALAASMPRDTLVSLGIVQPNFYGVFEDPEVWELTLGEVLDWGHNVLIPKMHELTSTQDLLDSDHVAGDHCQFCPVLLDCKVMQKAFKEYAEASEDFIVMLTDTELDAFYAQKEYARRFMNALDDVVKARLIGGSNIASAKLVEKRVNRVWKPGATAALTAAFGEAVFKPQEVKTPAQIEKLSSRGKDMALEWGYKPESHSLSVAPLSDPRPEAKPRTNSTVFADHAQTYEDQGF